MDSCQTLEKILNSFEHYYTINRENVPHPFYAVAEFHSHSEQYVLVKAAKIAEMDSNEYVYFINSTDLTFEELEEVSKNTWNLGLGKVTPYYGHRNSDVTLVVVTEKADPKISKEIKKIRYSKSYKFSIYGWSNFKLVVKELSSNQIYSNRLGSDLKKTLSKID